MAGDPACIMGRNVSPTRIQCADKTGKVTGAYRDAMSDQDLYVYQMQVAQQQASSAALSQQIAANNAAMNTNTAATLGRISSMPTPQVTPVYQPGGYDVRCISAGTYTNCRY